MESTDRRLPFIAVIVMMLTIVMGIAWTAIKNDEIAQLLGALAALVGAVLVVSWSTIRLWRTVYQTLADHKVRMVDAASVERTPDGGFVVIGDPRFIQIEKPEPLPQLSAPASSGNTIAVPPGFNAELHDGAVRLLQATIASPKYGPHSEQIMSADDAQAEHIFPDRDERSRVVGYLATNFGVKKLSSNGQDNGTFCPTGMNVVRLMSKLFVFK